MPLPSQSILFRIVFSSLAVVGCVRATPEEAKSVVVAAAPAPPSATPPEHAAPAHTAQEPAPPGPAKVMMRFEYVLTMTEPNKPPSTANYTLTLEENSSGELRQGENVPLVVSRPAPNANGTAPPSVGTARQDVGMSLKAIFKHPSEKGAFLHSDFEVSSIDPNSGQQGQPQSVRKVSIRGDVLVPFGKPAVLGSSEGPIDHRKYELSVSATKVP